MSVQIQKVYYFVTNVIKSCVRQVAESFKDIFLYFVPKLNYTITFVQCDKCLPVEEWAPRRAGGCARAASAQGVLSRCRLMRPLASFIYVTNVNCWLPVNLSRKFSARLLSSYTPHEYTIAHFSKLPNIVENTK